MKTGLRGHACFGPREAFGVRVLQHRFVWVVTDHRVRKAAVNRTHSRRFATSPPV